MKFICRKENVLSLLSSVARVAGKHPSLPILSKVLFEVTDGTLTVTATNLDVGITGSLTVQSEKDGSVAVAPQILIGYLTNLPKESKITIEHIDSFLHLSSDRASAKILVEETDEFPSLPQEPSTSTFTVTSEELLDALKSVAFVAASSTIKPELSSVLITSEDDFLICVATDGFRLAEKKISLPTNAGFGSILVPAKNVHEVVRVFDDNKEIVVSIGEDAVSFSTEKIYLTSRTVDGTYPDYKQLLSQEVEQTITLKKEELSSALKAVSVFSDVFQKVTIDLEPENTITILSKNTEIGENTVTISAPVEKKLQRSFNSRYLNEPLSVFRGENIVCKFTGEGRPLMLHAENDKSYIYVVMPMNR
jgi:DNA polymerase-3 subunit beta